MLYTIKEYYDAILKMDRGVKIVKTVKRVDKEGEEIVYNCGIYLCGIYPDSKEIVYNCGIYLDTELNLEQANKMIEEWNRNPEPNCTYSVEPVRIKRGVQLKIDD